MKKLTIHIVLFAAVLSAAFEAQAIGLSVSPKELKASTNIGETVAQKLNIKNLSGEVALFEIYPDDLKTLIEISPSSFILESTEGREVTVKIVPRNEGIFKTNISVVASPIASASFNAGSGVKIPLEIKAGQKSSWFLAMIPKLPLTYSRILGIVLLFIVVGASYFAIRYGIKQIKS